MLNMLATLFALLSLAPNPKLPGLTTTPPMLSNGDLVLEGHSDANGDVPELTPVEADKIRQGLAKAKELDPAGGAALEQAYREGRIGFARLGNGNISALGSHDWNTIAISSYVYDPTVIAVIMLHEWLHVTQCEGGPPAGGTTNDPTGSTTTDPCGPVTHMHNIAGSIHLLCGALGESDGFCRRCKALWVCLAELYSEADRATAAGCPNVPTPSTMYDEFCVDACRDCDV